MVSRLRPDVVDRLTTAAFTYAAVGASASDTEPAGYHSFRRVRQLTAGDFDSFVERLMTWQVQEGAGLRVAASSPRVTAGAVVMMRLGVGTVSLRIPCRVVYVVDEPDRRGFAYGTLPGHPEQGEELFLLERDARDRVLFTVSAFSRPASTLARLGGPVGAWAQRRMTSRYLAVLDRR